MVGRVPAAVRSSVLAVLVGIPLFALAGWQRGVFWHCAGVIALTALVAWQQARLAHRTKLQHRAETESGRTRDALLALHRTLELYAQQDGLTGLANRRQFDQVLHEEWQRARHTGSPLALILLDLDYLQPYNAQYGYLAGDDCMRAIAHAIRETKIRRPGDLAARYDGAHLAILLANTERDAACALAEQIRHAVCALRIMHPGNPAGVVTLSAGAAVCGHPFGLDFPCNTGYAGHGGRSALACATLMAAAQGRRHFCRRNVMTLSIGTNLRAVLGAALVISLLPFLAAQPVAAQEKIQIASLARNADGQPTQLDAYLFKPPASAGSGPYPAVVFVHGCGGLLTHSGKVLSRETDWAERLNQQGYLVLAVDSFSSRNQTSECAHGGPVTPQTVRPRDAYGALRYLQSRPDVIADRVALMGWSHGGGTVLYALGPNSPVNEGVPAGSTLPDFRTAIAFYPGWCSVREQTSAWHNTVPLLILMGASDVWTRPGPCLDFVDTVAAKGAPVQIHLYPDAYHDFDFPALPVREHPEFANRRSTAIPITGTNPVARADAIDRVSADLAQALRP